MSTTNHLPQLDALHTLRRHIDIVHHIPGRVRLRLGLPLLGHVERLDTGLLQMPPTLWQILTEGEDAQVEALLTPWLSRFAAELP